jgi:hypothetical protein
MSAWYAIWGTILVLIQVNFAALTMFEGTLMTNNCLTIGLCFSLSSLAFSSCGRGCILYGVEAFSTHPTGGVMKERVYNSNGRIALNV